jgi:hypothetical protein
VACTENNSGDRDDGVFEILGVLVGVQSGATQHYCYFFIKAIFIFGIW